MLTNDTHSSTPNSHKPNLSKTLHTVFVDKQRFYRLRVANAQITLKWATFVLVKSMPTCGFHLICGRPHFDLSLVDTTDLYI